MELGLTAARIRKAQEGWLPERIAAADRAAVYAVATAHWLGRADLLAVREAAAMEDETDELVRMVRWFDAKTYPAPGPLTVTEALQGLDGRFAPELVAAFRAVQPLIQPVGLE